MRTLICLLLLFAALGCGDGGSSSNADSGDDAATMADMGSDTTSPTNNSTISPEFEVGTNAVGENTADGFNALRDGEEIPFVFGVQGSWMVVLAFRTYDMFEDLFEVRASIVIDGVESGDIWLEAQETFPGGDGWDYYFSLFLPIDGDPPPRGTPIQITLSVTDADGTTVEREHDVIAGVADGP